nr:PREDICTED: leucine-rich repeat-containing protein 56 isoform X2 [Latimeria chalumnae]|eukprot:XP_005988056.1 PREDICTED: leucine-rich repeat-containing protein 56 isoform X2 [Latimeria chalumnae]
MLELHSEAHWELHGELQSSRKQALTGADDLRHVKTLEMCVDTRENSLGNFGAYLPNLIQLKLNNSLIVSVRDLGTTLSHLQVLWMARCGLPDLDGIPSFCSLRELYLAYNDISDLSQVSMLDHLEILDLEGNNIEDITQIQYLDLCRKLNMLTLEGNPVCIKPQPESPEVTDYSYRAEVKKLIPHLKYIDDIPVDQATALPISKVNEDWLIVKESIKEMFLTGDLEGFDDYPGTAAGRLGSSQQLWPARPVSAHKQCSAQRPTSAGRPGSTRPTSAIGSRPGSAGSDTVSEDDASDLTHGVGRVICGNPVKALCARRQKTAPSSPGLLNSLWQYMHKPEHTYDTEEAEDKSRDDIFAELKAWREDHKKRLSAIQKEKEPQVLQINHCGNGNDEDDYDDDEDYKFSDSFEEDEEKIKLNCSEESTDRVSPESSFHSPVHPSPPATRLFLICPRSFFLGPMALEKSQGKKVAPGFKHYNVQGSPSSVLQDSTLSPALPLYPSPPPLQETFTEARRGQEFRTRRLRRPVNVQLTQEETHQEVSNVNVGAGPADEEFVPCNESETAPLQVVRPKIPTGRPTGTLPDIKTLRPVSGPATLEMMSVKLPIDRGPKKLIDNHQPIIRSSTKIPERLTPPLHAVRPLTARAALQRLPNRPAFLPSPSKTTR